MPVKRKKGQNGQTDESKSNLAPLIGMDSLVVLRQPPLGVGTLTTCVVLIMMYWLVLVS